MTFRVLILGGTSEGRLLARQLAGDARFETLLSYAGRTESLQVPDTAHRIGGFGGVDGLVAFLRAGRFAALVDATHPFAARISANAVAAAAETSTPLLRLSRPVWQAQPGDRWTRVDTMVAAAHALRQRPQRVFLTVGRLEIAAFQAAPQHDYLVRAVDEFETGLPRARVLAARGPFALIDERALLVRERIALLVSKNSGTDATYAKIEAARQLSLPVVMVTPPTLPIARESETLTGVVDWLSALHAAHHEASPMKRGV